MAHEVGLGLKALLAAVLYRFSQYAAIALVRELQPVLRQVVVNVLCHGKTHRPPVLGLQVVEKDLVTMTDYDLGNKALNGGGY